MKLGFLYAGQGSQHAGMGADLYEAYPAFRAVFDRAAAEVDFDLKTTCFRDPDGLLNQTRYTQPCMVAFAAGLTAVLREKGILPAAVSGLSLGEYSALHAAGVLDAETAVRLVAFRGKAMEEAAAGHESAMVAVLNLAEEDLQAACDAASDLGVVSIANYNCPGQLVIAGSKAAVERAAALAKEKGARRCMPLNVSGPFHTSLMAPAGQALHEYFKGISFQTPQVPVYFNFLGSAPAGPKTDIPGLLVRQVQSSVYMEQCIRNMCVHSADALVEIGPGKALSGFAKKTVPETAVCAVETVADVEKLQEALASEIAKKEQKREAGIQAAVARAKKEDNP
ncbi:MAG: ACP S-malonyltransferase [Oscillibacter sp.]|nr:ACP S-malonyltransferase [Oscillibacter sp.]MCI9480942.1 ACP S-malonyltransferase [Oscillibacter sp.]